MREHTRIVLKKILRPYLRLALRVFFRRIESEGQEHVPLTTPLILAANHIGSLDPLVIQYSFPRELAVTAKSTLASKPILGALMKIGGVIQFHRKRDWGKGADLFGNFAAVAECMRRLELGEALCIFPEGTSNSDPKLRPFQQGTALIALEYAAAEARSRPLAILPVGQIYQIGKQLRPHVLVRFDDPIDIAQWLEENPVGGRRELTAEMEARVKALLPGFRRRRDPLLLSWAAEILATTGEELDPYALGSSTLSDQCRLMGQIQSGLTQWESTQPEAHRALTRRLQSHRIASRWWGLSSPRDLYLDHSLWCVAKLAFRELAFILVGLPIVVWGGLNHALFYLTARWLAHRSTTKRNAWASQTFYFSLLMLPLYYALQIAVAWILLPSIAAGCYTFLLPITGYGAVLCWERMAPAWRRARALAHLISDPPMRSRLRTESDSLRIELMRCCEAGEPR